MDTYMRHELQKDHSLGEHIVRCIVCRQTWDLSEMSQPAAAGIEYMQCPGVPQTPAPGQAPIFEVHDEQQFVGDIAELMKPGTIPSDYADLYDFSDFKPEHGEVPADYQSPAQKRKARIRELFAELGELLAEDGT